MGLARWLPLSLALFGTSRGELQRLVLLSQHGEAALRPQMSHDGRVTSFFGLSGEDKQEDEDASLELAAGSAAELTEVGKALRQFYLDPAHCTASGTCVAGGPGLTSRHVRAEAASSALALASGGALHAGLLGASVPIFGRGDETIRAHSVCRRDAAPPADDARELRRRVGLALLKEASMQPKFLGAEGGHEVPLAEWPHAHARLQGAAARGRPLASPEDLEASGRLARALAEPHLAAAADFARGALCGGRLAAHLQKHLSAPAGSSPAVLHLTVDATTLRCLAAALSLEERSWAPGAALALELAAGAGLRARFWDAATSTMAQDFYPVSLSQASDIDDAAWCQTCGGASTTMTCLQLEAQGQVEARRLNASCPVCQTGCVDTAIAISNDGLIALIIGIIVVPIILAAVGIQLHRAIKK